MRPAVALPLLLALAACNAPAEQVANAPRTAATAPAGSAPSVDPLVPAQIAAAQLGGELGCTFTGDGMQAPLLVASGMVSDPQGTAQAVGGGDGSSRQLSAVERGGFDGMLNGVEFAGEGFRYAIRLVPGEAAGGGESPPMPAELVVTAPWGKQARIAGGWTCGP